MAPPDRNRIRCWKLVEIVHVLEVRDLWNFGGGGREVYEANCLMNMIAVDASEGQKWR